MQAAIADARAWPGGPVTLRLPPGAPPELAALAGKTGVLAVALADYGGFEPVQRLVAAAVVDGAPLDPALAAQLCRLPAAEGLEGGPRSPWTRAWLDDAVDEAVFVDQREVETGEQKHFEQALGQLERFVEDKVLVCRRERASLAEQAARRPRPPRRGRRRDAPASGSRRRSPAWPRETKSLEQRINALDSREDEVYRKWRDQYHELRYQAPTVTPLFRAAFRIDPQDRPRTTSC